MKNTNFIITKRFVFTVTSLAVLIFISVFTIITFAINKQSVPNDTLYNNVSEESNKSNFLDDDASNAEKNDNYSDKDICWAREIVDNATGELYGISVLEYTSDVPDEDLGIIRLIIYPIEHEDAFDIWWNEIDEDNRPNGLIIYQAE